MINLTDISVFECDAVILATPATEAYGILQTAQDETPARRIIRVIDEIFYKPRYVVMASYDREQPDWKGIECNDVGLNWIGNETSKTTEVSSATSLVLHSSASFVKKYGTKSDQEITRMILDRAAEVTEPWLAQPKSTDLHFWKYYRAINPMKEYFMELEMEEAPLALVGDYFNGNSAESAYISGLRLAEYWIEKYDVSPVGAE